jgi:hypothetical protein
MPITASYGSLWDSCHSNDPEQQEKMKALSEGLDVLIEELSKSSQDKVNNKSILAGRISELTMADLFAEARIQGLSTFGLEGICTKYGQPIPTL